MKVTRITPENSAFFEELAPEGLFEDDDLFLMGAISGDGTACAVLATGVYGNMAYIKWIYTHPDFRKEGAAGELLRFLKLLLRKSDVQILQVSFSDEDDDLEDFLEEEGFLINEDNEMYSVPVKDLIYSKMAERLDEEKRSRNSVYNFSRVMSYYEFYDYLREKGVPVTGDAESVYKYSIVRLDEGRHITGFMLISKKPKGDLEIPYMSNDGSVESAMDIFRGFKELVTVHEWENENIVFYDRAGLTIEFVEKVTDEDRAGYVVNGQKQAMRTV